MTPIGEIASDVLDALQDGYLLPFVLDFHQGSIDALAAEADAGLDAYTAGDLDMLAAIKAAGQ
jgi:hypothetical protein